MGRQYLGIARDQPFVMRKVKCAIEIMPKGPLGRAELRARRLGETSAL